MSTRTPAPARSDDELDWDAEQEVDFGRWWRALVAHWWLPAAGLVLGAVIGYAISLNGTQKWQAKATIYLGQPYSASGNVQLQSAQTNPSTVKTVVHSGSVVAAAEKACKIKSGGLGGGISTAPVSGNLAKLGQTPEVTISVLSASLFKAKCAANALANAVVANPTVAGYANQKIRLLRSQVSSDEVQINAFNKIVTQNTVSATDKLVVLSYLRSAQSDLSQAAQLLAQAHQIEAPRVVTRAAASRVTARSRRTSVVVAALVGLLLGIVAALVWDPLAARAQR